MRIPPPRPRSEPKIPGGEAARAEEQPDRHPLGGRDHRAADQGRRCWGAYGSSATCRARLRATASSRWWAAQVPVLRRGSILARSER